VYQSPVNAGGLQIFGLAKNMASINIAPFMGGIVITEAAWNKVPDKYKPELLRIAKRHEAELDGAIQKLEADTIATMKQYGLVVNQVSPAQEQLWDADFKRALPKLLGKTFNQPMYEKIEEILKRK
jgi:TRAP-type C4-dicarboxylate transport system substrate-binding protein